jgi:hypothetical protein
VTVKLSLRLESDKFFCWIFFFHTNLEVMANIDAFKAPKFASKNTANEEIIDEDEVLIEADSLPASTLEKDTGMQIDHGEEGNSEEKPSFKPLKAKQMTVSKLGL